MTLFLIKLFHSVIFLGLSASTLYLLYSAIANRVTKWTKVAQISILMEGLILVLNNWRCPLTSLAEELGDQDGSVTDIFLPRWLADRVFIIYPPIIVLAGLILAGRRLWGR